MKTKVRLGNAIGLLSWLMVVWFLIASESFALEGESIISSFESQKDISKWDIQRNANIELSREYSTQGKYSAKVTFSKEAYSGIFTYPEEKDWSKCVYISMETYNPQKQSLGFAFSIGDNKGENVHYGFSAEGENLDFRKFPLFQVTKNNPEFDLKNVNKITLVTGTDKEKEVVLYLDNLRLLSPSDTTFNFPSLADFETEKDLGKLSVISVKVELADDYASDGDHSCKVTFLNRVYPWPSLLFYVGNGIKARDWSSYEKLVFDVHNPNEKELSFAVELTGLKDEKKPGWWGTTAPAGQEITVEYPISVEEGGFDLSNVSYFNITTARPEKDTAIYIDDIRLVK